MRTDPTYRRAFTLIEILVVVAIIALLIAVLLPSLNRARLQARLTLCKANCKQIATIVASYQSEAKGHVPILLNWHAGPVYHAPARAVFLSVSLRRYEQGLTNLAKVTANSGGTFDPNTEWSQAKRDEYEARFLPDHYVCPFQRGREPWDLRQVGATPLHTLWEWSGVMESYQTWLWEDIIRGKQVYSEPKGWGGSAANGTPKYSALSWNSVTLAHSTPSNADIQHRLHRQWTDSDARRLQGGSLSMMTTMYCAIGEHMELGSRRVDVGSHPTGRGGGANTAFADSHVEWVDGPRIGWP